MDHLLEPSRMRYLVKFCTSIPSQSVNENLNFKIQVDDNFANGYIEKWFHVITYVFKTSRCESIE